MALVLRIDVDRPYGRAPFLRHALSRVSSDLFLPAISSFGYLKELAAVLRRLNAKRARSYVFFRRCTAPSDMVLGLLEGGRHKIGLHLENSRSIETLRAEKEALEKRIGGSVTAMSKHGSGREKYGRTHYAPYEPEKYLEWAVQLGIRTFLGNLEDPTLPPIRSPQGVLFFPAAFWLEPHWRNTERFPVEWLLAHAKSSDVVMLIHPENVLADPKLLAALDNILDELETRVLE